jgi:hypothetical protein
VKGIRVSLGIPLKSTNPIHEVSTPTTYSPPKALPLNLNIITLGGYNLSTGIGGYTNLQNPFAPEVPPS